MSTSTRAVQKIRTQLEKTFSPQQLEITDDSHWHIGHAGAQSGKGHYTVIIRAAAFVGKSPLQRHRMVYDALGELMDTDIHALSIRAKGPTS